MTLTRRLNLWYGAVVVATILLGLSAAELESARIASLRHTDLVERAVTEVRDVYRSGGTEAVERLRYRDLDLHVVDAEGLSLLPEGTAERVTRLDHGVWLHTSIPHDAAVATRREVRRALLGGGLVVLVLTLLGGSLVTRRALRPVRQVADTARRIVDQGEADARVPVPGTGDELDEMVGLLNRLLDSQQAMVEQMHRSLDSIGHDLRTPMTRLRAAAELALDQGDRDALTDALELALEEAAASEQLLTRLLDLTRAEAGTLPLELTDVAPGDNLRRVASLYEHVAEDRGVALTVHVPHGAPAIRADATRLTQALANLADNALKLAPSGSEVRLAVRTAPGQVGLSVSDRGPGVPPEEQERIFERLYRGDQARGTGGAGLGLAMVRAIAHAHGGFVELVSAPGEGATFTLWLRPGGAASR